MSCKKIRTAFAQSDWSVNAKAASEAQMNGSKGKGGSNITTRRVVQNISF